MKNFINYYYWEFHFVPMIAIGWLKEKHGNHTDGILRITHIFILCFKISLSY